MAAAWKGAVEFAGFPVNVALHNRVKSRSGDSFKTLGSDGKPIKMVMVESGEYAKLEKDEHAKVSTIGRSDTSKGVAVGKDVYKALPPEAIEAVTSAERSSTVTPRTFVPLVDVPVELADKAFVVTPDEKVPGSEKSVNLLWNGLLASGLAYTTEVTTRAGSRDAILVIYAQDDGLFAVALPFEAELADVPTFAFSKDAKAANLFGKFVEGEYEVREGFDLGEYQSTYRATREDAIAKALAGEEITIPEPTKPTDEGDLLAALEAAVETPKKAKPKARKAPAKKAPRKTKAKA